MKREPHIYTAAHDPGRRPFEEYVDQPDTAQRKRLAEFMRIPFALPPRRKEKQDA